MEVRREATDIDALTDATDVDAFADAEEVDAFADAADVDAFADAEEWLTEDAESSTDADPEECVELRIEDDEFVEMNGTWLDDVNKKGVTNAATSFIDFNSVFEEAEWVDEDDTANDDIVENDECFDRLYRGNITVDVEFHVEEYKTLLPKSKGNGRSFSTRA